MTEPAREDRRKAFLRGAGWASAERHFLAGDASNRSYDRLTMGPRRAVLMDAPPEKGEATGPFVAMARHLRGLGLSAPEIFDEDAANGFLLLEDLGDALFARVLAAAPELEVRLYSAATDTLAHLQASPAPAGLPDHTRDFMAGAAGLSVSWYAYAVTGIRSDPAPMADAMTAALAAHCCAPPVLVLRDYHAENLIWMPDRHGLAAVGLLDFQMGSMGQPGYDLISLLQDARRDVGPNIEAAMIARFAAATNVDPLWLEIHCAVLGAQRALRILGGFSRLSLHFGKPGYVRLIPLVWAHLLRNLAHPALSDLHKLAQDLPEPTPEALQRITDQCGTVSTL
ncbi:MAG: phosphotransferase [Gemmobacter sp.]|nr:phosphotransferase [Gemmobacter sp.]